jgi:hypothetical protein
MDATRDHDANVRADDASHPPGPPHVGGTDGGDGQDGTHAETGSLEAVAQATDPTKGDPFVELGLVDHDRWVAPGGWRRGLVGFAVGAGAGWLVTIARHADTRAGTSRWGRP